MKVKTRKTRSKRKIKTDLAQPRMFHQPEASQAKNDYKTIPKHYKINKISISRATKIRGRRVPINWLFNLSFGGSNRCPIFNFESVVSRHHWAFRTIFISVQIGNF